MLEPYILLEHKRKEIFMMTLLKSHSIELIKVKDTQTLIKLLNKVY
jgi:hypothetical protein